MADAADTQPASAAPTAAQQGAQVHNAAAQQQVGQRRQREEDDVPAELYSMLLLALKLADDYPVLTQNLRDYLAQRGDKGCAEKVIYSCSVKQYLDQQDECCKDTKTQKLINDMPGMQVAQGLLKLSQAGCVSVGAWTAAGMPTDVAGVSAETYSRLEALVLAARAATAKRRRLDDQTSPSLHYTTAAGDSGLRSGVTRETALPQQLDDYGVERAAGEASYNAQHAATAVMHTLHSRRGWPTSWSATDATDIAALPATAPPTRSTTGVTAAAKAVYNSTLFVRREVQRAWHNIAVRYNKVYTARLNTGPLSSAQAAAQSRTGYNTISVVVLGTPGIGKTMSGNYMVYRLLRDANAPRYIAFAVGERVYIFDKQRKRVSCYERGSFNARAFASAVDNQCVYIHDINKGKYILEQGDHLPVRLMVVLTSPQQDNYYKYKSKPLPGQYLILSVMNSWSYHELYCASRLVGLAIETMRQRVQEVGPLPRYVMDDARYERRAQRVAAGIDVEVRDFTRTGSLAALDAYVYDDTEPTSALYDMRRHHALQRGDDAADEVQDDAEDSDSEVLPQDGCSDTYIFKLMSTKIERDLFKKLIDEVDDTAERLQRIISVFLDHRGSYETFVLYALNTPLFWLRLHNNRADARALKRCFVNKQHGKRPPVVVPLTADAITQWTSKYASARLPLRRKLNNTSTVHFAADDTAVLCLPLSPTFTLVDAFVLVRYGGGVHFVGIQATIAEDHAPTYTNMSSFIEDMPELVVEGAQVADSSGGRPSGDAAQRAATPGAASLQRDAASGARQRTSAESGETDEGSIKLTTEQIEEKLQRLRNVIASWSVVYVGDSLRHTSTFDLKDVPQETAPAQQQSRPRDDVYTRFWASVQRYVYHATDDQLMSVVQRGGLTRN